MERKKQNDTNHAQVNNQTDEMNHKKKETTEENCIKNKTHTNK